MSPRILKNVDFFESYLKFKKTLKFGFFFNIFFKIQRNDFILDSFYREF